MVNNVRPRRIILDLAVTLDGFIEGVNGEVDWCIMDPEMGFSNFLNQIDVILYGRKSYDLWGQYTPEIEDADLGGSTQQYISFLQQAGIASI